ncbi:MAG: carbohydrate ABC transporter permease [Chloroflexi bacterium]|jgi:multiple sugar transport system permease protein|nr:MAG: ABC transporter permease [Chloroflexi bacterium OLB13]MBC6956858.1 carbohydrate ABC transporter permease [Chloroflexota bacterium]MBV6437814.1 L-arabinose transport system permease protein AraQ [Anaerolineae bacterium]MDL1916457.1 carbohydrate ABC transporter permease [Anaerolineae bacterium CFX4]OQY80677.1 MAG: sugar ABC transporter permease [Anaerolineae bacterium UTCFX5]
MSRAAAWPYKTFSYLMLTLIGLTMIVPFLWMIATSFKPATEILRPNFFPVAPTLTNYETVLFDTALPRWYWNSIVVAVMSTVSVAFFDSLAGYVFAKYQFPGKRIIFILFLSSLMVPTEMLIIPWYIMSVHPIVGSSWVDTYWGIAFPGLMTAAGVFLMRQFMQGVPNELLDAARMDGVSEFGLFWRIAIPLALPAVGALCIFNFLGNWNAFIWPLIITSSQNMMTLPVGIQFFSTESGANWNLIMTGATLSVVPLLLIVIFFQRYIIDGIALTGIKG